MSLVVLSLLFPSSGQRLADQYEIHPKMLRGLFGLNIYSQKSNLIAIGPDEEFVPCQIDLIPFFVIIVVVFHLMVGLHWERPIDFHSFMSYCFSRPLSASDVVTTILVMKTALSILFRRNGGRMPVWLIEPDSVMPICWSLLKRSIAGSWKSAMLYLFHRVGVVVIAGANDGGS